MLYIRKPHKTGKRVAKKYNVEIKEETHKIPLKPDDKTRTEIPIIMD